MRIACCRSMRARTPALPGSSWNTRYIPGGRAIAKKYGLSPPSALSRRIFTICPFYADHGIIIDSVSGGVAQLVERGIHKPKVSGSSPDAASNRATWSDPDGFGGWSAEPMFIKG